MAEVREDLQLVGVTGEDGGQGGVEAEVETPKGRSQKKKIC